jgi:hypothetical protein
LCPVLSLSRLAVGPAAPERTRFEEWLAGFAVIAAYVLRLLSLAERNPGRQTVPRLEV